MEKKIKKNKKIKLKFFIISLFMVTIMIFFITVSKDIDADKRKRYWSNMEGVYEGQIIDIVTIDSWDPTWEIIILETRSEYHISPNNRPFFLIANAHKILFIDNGPLNGLSKYSLNDKITINLNDDSQELECIDQNNKFKFKKEGLPLLTTQFPKNEVRKLNKKHGFKFKKSELKFPYQNM